MTDIKFDILNYITLRGPEIKEIFITISNEEIISKEKLLEYYILDKKNIPKYFKDIPKLLLQIGLIKEENDSYEVNPSFSELSFELNFFHKLSLLDGIYRMTYEIHKELISQDILSMKNQEFLPWCLDNFGSTYTMTKNSATFWINLVNNLGFIQKLKWGNRTLFLVLPEINHYNDLLSFFQTYNNNKESLISIKEFGEFVSGNFFEIFNKKGDLSISFQDWIKFLEIKEKIELRTFSDATEFQIKDKRVTHIEIKNWL